MYRSDDIIVGKEIHLNLRLVLNHSLVCWRKISRVHSAGLRFKDHEGQIA